MTKILFAGLAALILAGCNTTTKYAGTGELELSQESREMLSRYLDELEPGVFLVKEDGSYENYYYCDNAKCWPTPSAEAVSKRSEPCKVLAVGRKIV